MKSFFELRESSSDVNLTEATVSRSDFEKLKKGMRIEIDFGSSISSSQKRVFTVKSTSRSAKYNVDKINMTIDGRGKYHLYSRGGKDATLALGNMAAIIKSYKILGTNESVELDEAADFMKMSKELLKHKSKGIEFEKAAAYVRLIHNNSAVSVQDKAFMALTKMLKDMDDLVKKTTITKILKDNGFKVRGGSLMREGLEDSVELGEEHLTEVKWTLGGKEVEVSKMTPAQIAQMRKMFGKIKTVSNDNPYKKKGKDMIADLSKLELKIIAKAKIKWLSDWAEEELRKRAPLDRRINIESLDENYRTLAVHGMGAETKNEINVGRGVDFYEPKNGDKRMGKITKMTKTGFVVKDEKDGKSYAFAYYDRAKAKALLAKHG